MRFLNDDTVVVSTSEAKKTLQVIAAGLPRCATSSIQEAFESPWLNLGPSMHMAHVFPHVERGELVVAAINEKDPARRQKMVRQLFAGHAATSDFPGICFIEDLMDLYPDAPVILNQRESAEVWAKSFGDSLGFFESRTYRYITLLWKQDRVHTVLHRECNIYFDNKFRYNGSGGEGMGYNVRWYEDYNAMVRKAAKDRGRPLLEWKPQDGWRPICEFLGKECPPEDVPFPRVNDQKSMRVVKTILVARGLLSWAALGGLVYTGCVYGPRWFANGLEWLRS